MIIAKATNSTAKIFTKAMPILSGLIIAIKDVLKKWGAWYDLGTWLVNNSYVDIIALDK